METNEILQQFRDRHEAVAELIIADLKIHKLFNGMATAGVDPSSAGIQLHKQIVTLIGIPNTKAGIVFEWYHSVADQVLEFDLTTDEDKVKEIAFELYHGLLDRKENKWWLG